MDIIREQPNTIPAPPDLFTGSAFVDVVSIGQGPSRLRALRVHFTPGARTAWHNHPLGQVLIVTDGAGRVQSRGGSVEVIRAGDTVVAAPGEWHWHGAGPESFMTHLALQEAGPDGTEASWDVHVSDSDYLGHRDARDRGPT